MKKLVINQPIALIAGALLLLPSLCFFIAAIPNDVGIYSPLHLIEPIFGKTENQHFGLNVNILLAFGPLIAVVINLPHVVQVFPTSHRGYIDVHIHFKKNGISWMIMGAGLLCLATLFFYLFNENCNC